MLKNSLFLLLLSTFFLVFAIAKDETITTNDNKQNSLSQCDKKYDQCIENCGDEANEACTNQCEESAAQCDISTQTN